jgi:FkbM family methyltransferase
MIREAVKQLARRYLSPGRRAAIARAIDRTAQTVTSATAAAAAAPFRILPDALTVAVRERLELRRKLDYPAAPLLLLVTSEIERRTRLWSCRKEPETVAWLHDVLRNGGVFYDIGANVGAYSLIAARLVQATNGAVYAFEPGYRTYANLVDNVLMNGLSDVIVPMPIAANSETAVVKFDYAETRAGGANHGGLNGESRSVATQTLVACRLDDAIDLFALRKPTCMKVDVDGGEAEVLRGATALLADSNLKHILIEIDHDAPTMSIVGDMLRKAGFQVVAEHRRGESGTHNMIWSRT